MFEDVPKEMKRLNNWVLFKFETRFNKKTGKEEKTKVPYRPSGYKASVKKPESWKGFGEIKSALEKGSVDGAGFDGVGFVFSKENVSMPVYFSPFWPD